MAKAADRYLTVDPWVVAEEGFGPARARVSESVFSLANEFMGVRGYFEEGYSGDHLQGSYFGGLYENQPVGHPQVFKGFVTRENFIVNAVDWLYVRIAVDGETLDLAASRFEDFVRRVDMRRGVLERSLTWETGSGKRLRVRFERFLSMADRHLACQRVTVEPMGWSGEVAFRSGLDFDVAHELAAGWDMRNVTGSDRSGPRHTFWEVLRKAHADGLWAIEGKTKTTDFAAFSGFRLRFEGPPEVRSVEEERFVGCEFSLPVCDGRAAGFEKIVVNFWERPDVLSAEEVWDRGMALAREHADATFESALADHTAYWDRKWTDLDIEIDGPADLQQGIRFELFQIHMTYHGGDDRLAIPSKGLTAEVYSGWAFWVVETYVQHMMIFTDPEASRKLLGFRYRGLPAAIERARQVDCRGARYPFCTIDGPESCATWQHADMEIHVGEGIYRAIQLYALHADDTDFLYREGIEMLLEISRFYASRGGWSPVRGDFGFYGVMGPDEYHTVVNHNCYTNWMGKKCFEYTLEVVGEMERKAPELLAAVKEKVDLDPGEPDEWRRMADKMRIPRDPETGVCEQHEGYFDLPEVDVQAIGPDEVPIYNTWAYERILRTSMVKQADVLLLPVWFAHEWTYEEKRANYDFYEPRTIHESSFSPSIHMVLAAELGRKEQADEFFRYMVRLDLDNYHRNTAQGLHMTPKSGSWMCVTYGYAGMRTDRAVLSFLPTIPDDWSAYRFRIVYRGAVVEVRVDRQGATFRVVRGPDVPAEVYGEPVTVTRAGVRLPLKAPGPYNSAEYA